MGRKVDSDKHFKEAQRAYARGGHDRMFSQQAASPKIPGRTGKLDARGPGEKFPKGGGKDHIFGGHAVPAEAGVTATTRHGAHSRTRDYGKTMR
jgi:hypothetical protein